MTGQQLIEASLRKLGVLRTGWSITAAELADLLVTLNQKIASWSAEGFALHQVVRDAHALTGAASYTMGTGATINTARPLRIVEARTVNSSNVGMPARIVTAAEWAAEVDDDSATGDWVELLFCDYGHPSVTVRVSPKPTGSSLELFSLKPLSSIATLATAIDFPPGYEHGLITNFALAIASDYGRTATPELTNEAASARAAVGTFNSQILPAAPAQG